MQIESADSKDVFTAVEKTCRFFRFGMEAQAGGEFAAAISLLTQRLARMGQEDLAAINPFFELVIHAQMRKDYLYVADLLEYEIMPRMIIAWQSGEDN